MLPVGLNQPMLPTCKTLCGSATATAASVLRSLAAALLATASLLSNPKTQQEGYLQELDMMREQDFKDTCLLPDHCHMTGILNQSNSPA